MELRPRVDGECAAAAAEAPLADGLCLNDLALEGLQLAMVVDHSNAHRAIMIILPPNHDPRRISLRLSLGTAVCLGLAFHNCRVLCAKRTSFVQ